MDILRLFTFFFCPINNGLISTEFDHKNYILTFKWLCSSLDICKWFLFFGGFKGLIWAFANLIVCGWNGSIKLKHGLCFKQLQIEDEPDAKSWGKEIEFIEWLLQVSFVERHFNGTWIHIVYLGRLSCRPPWSFLFLFSIFSPFKMLALSFCSFLIPVKCVLYIGSLGSLVSRA